MTLLLLAALVARCGQNQLILAAPKKKTIEVLLLIYLCGAVVARVFGVWMERCQVLERPRELQHCRQIVLNLHVYLTHG